MFGNLTKSQEIGNIYKSNYIKIQLGPESSIPESENIKDTKIEGACR